MQTVDESTMDDVITTIDFATLFSQEELKAKRAEEKDRRKKNRILSVENSHFLIYLICLLISIVLIAAYLFLPCAETSKWLAVLMSLGASGFGAALLAFFIDRSDTDAQDKAAVDAYNNSVAYIYDTLWTVFGNRSYQYMKKIDKNTLDMNFSFRARNKPAYALEKYCFSRTIFSHNTIDVSRMKFCRYMIKN